MDTSHFSENNRHMENLIISVGNYDATTTPGHIRMLPLKEGQNPLQAPWSGCVFRANIIAFLSFFYLIFFLFFQQQKNASSLYMANWCSINLQLQPPL